jgi:cyclopropane fatty-acyl-phospholipid synthase-like methyltransferase
MEHTQAIDYWEGLAQNNPDEKSVKVNSFNDFTAIDAEFILKHADTNSSVLDLASGTGLVIGKYFDKVAHVDAVELFPEFSKFIVQSPNIDVYNESIEDFDPTKEYDLILMFGIVQYFNESEIRRIYAKYKKFLKASGKLIIKNQFGVNEDVTVTGMSEELNKPYYSQYRHLAKEVELLKSLGFQSVQTFDIYPPEANRWDNTHFYAITADV